MNRIFLVFFMAVAAVAAHAQSSVNTYSPYTMYGLGDIRAQGTAAQVGMGGVGVASRGMLDYVNPASLSALPRNSFHFNFGIEGGFFYLDQGKKNTSYNTFNIRDIVLRMPLTRKLGFGLSLSPFSSVGYRIKKEEDVPPEFFEMGVTGINFQHKGSGDVSQAKLSLGWEPVKRLSVGVDMIYYFGKIDRDYSTLFLTNDPMAHLPSVDMRQAEKISRLRWGFGAQYNIIEQSGATAQSYKVLTAGLTYLPKLALKPSISVTASTQELSNSLGNGFKMPETFAAGLYYRTWKLGAGIDYERQNWAQANEGTDEMSFRNTDAFRAGAEFTPSRFDVRSFLKRITYRAGIRHSGYYMNFKGEQVDDTAVSLGLGIPLKTDRESYLDLGLEYGNRSAKDLINENYFRVSIGFRLSGEGWFQKRMYY